MYSDNGSNFREAEKELRDLFSKIAFDEISKTLTNYNINWKFIPPLSPWMRGAWESIAKLTKRALRIVSHDRPMYEDSLSTFITEIESVLNSRPLTSVTDDPNDYKILTPNHFLLGRQTLPFTLNDEKAFNRVCWRAVEALSNMFWKRFIQEYLPMLNIRKKWNREKRDFKENDFIIMKNEHQHRSLWSVGRIIFVNKGIDGKVRSVQVRLPNSTLTRPVNTLCLLEECEQLFKSLFFTGGGVLRFAV